LRRGRHDGRSWRDRPDGLDAPRLQAHSLCRERRLLRIPCGSGIGTRATFVPRPLTSRAYNRRRRTPRRGPGARARARRPSPCRRAPQWDAPCRSDAAASVQACPWAKARRRQSGAVQRRVSLVRDVRHFKDSARIRSALAAQLYRCAAIRRAISRSVDGDLGLVDVGANQRKFLRDARLVGRRRPILHVDSDPRQLGLGYGVGQ
jgi:hypothetical protein